MSFKIQKKTGKGIKTADENILTSFATNTLDTAMIFTSTGKMYKLPVDKIPEGTNTTKVQVLVQCLSLNLMKVFKL